MGAGAPEGPGKDRGAGPILTGPAHVSRKKLLPARLALKLAVCLVAGIGAFFALFGYLNLRLQRKQFEDMVVISADRVSDIIQRSTRYDMMMNDRDGLHHLIRDIGSEPGIRRVRIFNEDGRIRFSTEPEEVDTMVDKSAEACYGCHAREAPLVKLARPDRARIFQEPGGGRTLGVIRPIENQNDCSSAPCHAHPAGRRILGVIDAQLSLAGVDQQLREHQAQLTRFTVVAIALVSMLSAVFVWAVVHRPIHELMAGIQRVASGNLRHRIQVHSNDELGTLAESFNHMTEDLETAHAELTEWARTLEERVRRKGEELERAHGSLVASEKMASLGKLAATVAHEVNNPLFGMLTYARLTLKSLQKPELDGEARASMMENLRIIERESRRCGDLMKNLLTFARHTPPHRAPNSLNTLVERALHLVCHQLDLQGIELERKLDPALPDVCCDAGQIQQVLLVLLVNATEAMPSGGALTVATEVDSERDAVLVRVRDNGPGIPEDVLPRIFEPFFTTKENQQRTGLGLAIASSIIEQHAGRIDVRSAAGAGTEFLVTLPVSGTELPGLRNAAGKGVDEIGQFGA